jgi:hypothetical protein
VQVVRPTFDAVVVAAQLGVVGVGVVVVAVQLGVVGVGARVISGPRRRYRVVVD